MALAKRLFIKNCIWFWKTRLVRMRCALVILWDGWVADILLMVCLAMICLC